MIFSHYSETSTDQGKSCWSKHATLSLQQVSWIVLRSLVFRAKTTRDLRRKRNRFQEGSNFPPYRQLLLANVLLNKSDWSLGEGDSQVRQVKPLQPGCNRLWYVSGNWVLSINQCSSSNCIVIITCIINHVCHASGSRTEEMRFSARWLTKCHLCFPPPLQLEVKRMQTRPDCHLRSSSSVRGYNKSRSRLHCTNKVQFWYPLWHFASTSTKTKANTDWMWASNEFHVKPISINFTFPSTAVFLHNRMVTLVLWWFTSRDVKMTVLLPQISLAEYFHIWKCLVLFLHRARVRH